jgi:hypothetical protein
LLAAVNFITMGFWIICKEDYTVDGKEFTKGTIEKMNKNSRGFHERYWRIATNKEVEGKKWFKGIWYNLNLPHP